MDAEADWRHRQIVPANRLSIDRQAQLEGGAHQSLMIDGAVSEHLEICCASIRRLMPLDDAEIRVISGEVASLMSNASARLKGGVREAVVPRLPAGQLSQ